MNRKTAERDYERRDDGYDVIRTNLDRAQQGRDMCADAHNGCHYLAYESYEVGLVDALTNLMHYARRYEIAFEDALSLARAHHDHESTIGWED